LVLHTSGDSAIGHIVDVICRHGSEIKTIHTIEPSLEDVFLHLTGRAMRNEATGKVPSGKVSHRTRRAGRRVR
ncbi:MAG: hypothetical protein ABIB93_06345, partial [Chloroflexota bacterium]